MIKQTNPCIFLIKYIWNKQVMVALTTLLLILNAFQITAAPSLGAAMQPVTITGSVADQANTPLAGVYVVLEGTNTGVITDVNGKYSIQVPDQNAKLVFSFMGFLSETVTVAGKSVVDVTMTPDVTALEEVVVIGYGTVKKKDVTGSVASISAEKLQEVQSANLTSQLKGRTAGVDIVSNGSTPGTEGRIRIRGERSLSGSNDPLLVVDGIPFTGSMNDLNPNDILSVDILKDASATAIYGFRGANGVIIISTKRGKSGKAIVSYDGYYGVTKLMKKLDLFNGAEFAAFKDEAKLGNHSSTPNTNAYALTPIEQIGLDNGVDTDWQDLIYQTGHTIDQQLGVSGGSENTQFSLGVGYYNETGIIPQQKLQRYSLRTTIDHQINKKLKVGLNTLITLSYIDNVGNPVATVMKMSPLVKPYNDDGTINLQPQVGSTDASFVNPLTIKDKDALYNRTRRIRTFNSLYGEWNILEFLKYRINVGLDFSQSNQNSYTGPNTVFNTSSLITQARSNITNTESYSYTIENLLFFDKTFDKHRIGFTGLYSIQKTHDQGSSFDGLGVPADYFQNTNLTLVDKLTATSNTPPANAPYTWTVPNYFKETGTISYMARINYAFADRYLLTASIRKDGSSVLAPGNKWFTYPALALAWNVANEQFMKSIPVLSVLKLRLGWGKTANASIAPYTTLGALTTNYYNFGTSGYNGYYLTSLPSPGLEWESTAQYNIGLDFGLLKNRITGSIDYYNQNTDGILLQKSLPISNGASNVWVNAGETKGHGIEIALSGVIVKTASGFTWSTDITFAKTHDEIVALQDPKIKEDVGNGWFVGHPLTVIYDYKKIGIWQTDDAAEMAAQTSPVQFAGQIRVQDRVINGVADNKITSADRQIIGDFEPDWVGGMTNTFAFKGFDLSVVMYARMGQMVVVPYITADGGANGYPFFMQSRNNQLKVDYWTADNPTNKFPQPDASTDRLNYGSTLGYVDGSFIKVRTINLGYNIPSKLLEKVGIMSLRVFVNVLNPFVLYSPFVKDGYGPDPEGNGYGGAVSPTGTGSATAVPNRAITVNANTPATRQFNMGVNLKF
jgi:TonB-linked SusC/RagA family outer membrane protein